MHNNVFMLIYNPSDMFLFFRAGPTMKLRRPIVVKMYQEKINEMYAVAKQ